MVYALQKFRHYFLGGHFKLFTDHSILMYLVNKPVLEGIIFVPWLLLFQEFSFEVIVNPRKLNVGPYHLSRLNLGESGGVVDDQLPNANLFCIEAILNYLSDIALFLTTGTMSEGLFHNSEKAPCGSCSRLSTNCRPIVQIRIG
jgi:hypothetical protein